jgi:hypothetical protein
LDKSLSFIPFMALFSSLSRNQISRLSSRSNAGGTQRKIDPIFLVRFCFFNAFCSCYTLCVFGRAFLKSDFFTVRSFHLLNLLIYRTVRYQNSTTTVMSITRMRRIPQYKTQEEDYFYFAKGRRHGKRKLITIC